MSQRTIGGEDMAEATDCYRILYQNLVDAGCDGKTVKNCMEYAKSGEWSVLPLLLGRRRKSLLERLHTDQQQIDCLDFLLYKLKKDNSGGI